MACRISINGVAPRVMEYKDSEQGDQEDHWAILIAFFRARRERDERQDLTDLQASTKIMSRFDERKRPMLSEDRVD